MPEYSVTDLTRQVASIIRGHMAKYSITQAEMAEAAGVSQSQLSKMIRGLRSIDIDQLAAMCSSMEMSAADVLAEAEQFLSDFDVPHAARLQFVSDGIRERVPLRIEQQEHEPLIPTSGRAGRKVQPVKTPVSSDLETMPEDELRARYDLAADNSKDTSDPDLRTP